jgi:LuxR family transcriptional regulator, quorum-sensing system regulator BjaR1
MLHANSVFEFIEEIEQKNDIPSLIESFQALIGKFGMACFLMGDPTRPTMLVEDRLWASTFPEDWMTEWSNQNYVAVDPVASNLVLLNRPLRWKEIRSANDPGTRVLDSAADYRLNDGFALPIYSRDGCVVGISMATENYELDKRDESSLHLASLYFHAKLERLRAENTPRLRTPKLTRRERECLSWVAAGKTDWEISQILNIAEQTAHEYVQNALTKLGAATRAQAVAIAILLKLILA